MKTNSTTATIDPSRLYQFAVALPSCNDGEPRTINTLPVTADAAQSTGDMLRDLLGDDSDATITAQSAPSDAGPDIYANPSHEAWTKEDFNLICPECSSDDADDSSIASAA